MEVTESLSGQTMGSGQAGSDPGCPRCQEPLPPLPSVEAKALGGVRVRRCTRCGTRSTESTPARLVFSCETCGLLFETGDLLPKTEQVCPECAEGKPPAALPDALVVRATENEVRAALASRWRFVGSSALSTYLERLTRQLARLVEGAPAAARVHLVDDPGQRTLALPSGALLVSLGTLRFLEDEAELVFVLGHELAHAASGDAAVRLVRLGFDAVARGHEGPTPEAWSEAALDLVRLGYGRKRERDADARALEVVLALDYDPEAVFRYLRRLKSAMESADARVAELAVSHPSPTDRLRRLERSLWGRIPDAKILRLNREVFRRAAGSQVLAGLSRTELPAGSARPGAAEEHPEGAPRGKRHRVLPYVVWTALGLLALAAGFFLLR